MCPDLVLAKFYRKDPDEEAFLEDVNMLLRDFERTRYDPDLPELYPTLHVLGTPRSGTTLLIQLIASHLNIGCINNLIAAFWAAPCCGIRLSRKLLGDQPRPSSYQSDYGRTRGVYEPHEFGYFWSNLLGYRELRAPWRHEREAIDWRAVRTVFMNMSLCYGRPIVFKSFMAMWYMVELQKAMPKSCFLWMRRDLVDTAVSLLHQRLKYVATPDEWVSLKPPEYESLRTEPLHRQVAGQAVFLDRCIQQGVAEIDGRNVIEISYEALCRNPRAVLDDVCQMTRASGYAAEVVADCPATLSASRPSRMLSEDERKVEWHVKDLMVSCGG